MTGNIKKEEIQGNISEKGLKELKKRSPNREVC